jgi:hypothetical protein
MRGSPQHTNKPTRPEWQRVTDQINAAPIFARADFVKVDGMHRCCPV